MNLLVLRGGALGDFIVTMPALAALRARWPDANIELVGNAVAAQLAVNRGILSRAHSQHESRWSALYADAPLPNTLTSWLARFEAVVSYWPDPDGTLARHFPLRAGQRFLSAPAMPTRGPAAAHYCAALEPLGIGSYEYVYRVAPLAAEQRREGSLELLDVGRGLPTPPYSPIAVHPGSGSQRKNWPEERWIELIGRLNGPILIIVGEAEAARWTNARFQSDPLAQRIRDGTLEIAANLPLEALISRLAECRLFLGHDSGVSHLAAACGIPSILLFGPTDPAIWAPPAADVRVLQRGPNLSAITIDEVEAAIEAIHR